MFGQTGPSQRVDCLAPGCGSVSVKCLSQRHNNALPSSETVPRVDNLAVANLRSYPLS